MRSATQQALRGATELNLSPREFALLHLFLTHPATVLNRAQILETVWARTRTRPPTSSISTCCSCVAGLIARSGCITRDRPGVRATGYANTPPP
jgi:hypothetical protein